MEATSSLALAGALVAAPAAGLAETRVLMCLCAALVCLAREGKRLPRVLGETTAPAEKLLWPIHGPQQARASRASAM